MTILQRKQDSHFLQSSNMLIEFTLANWMSFRDEVTFSTLASEESRHEMRLPYLKKFETKILPTSVIYGGNASGKSNFFEALRFAKFFVVDGCRKNDSIPVAPFSIDKRSEKLSTRFKFIIFHKERIFKYEFTLNQKKVLYEKLVDFKNSKEHVLYERRAGKPFYFSKSIKEKSKKFLDVAIDATRDNKLFLTTTIDLNSKLYQPVYDWFNECLVLINPNLGLSQSTPVIIESSSLPDKVSKMISQLDTGISEIEFEKIDISSSAFPKKMIQMLEAIPLRTDQCMLIVAQGEGTIRKFHFLREEGIMVCYEWIPVHGGDRTKFEMDQESTGSLRLIQLLPALYPLYWDDSRKVYIVDELDRSLHTLLTNELIETYLGVCSEKTRSQLIFTTHDIMLMSQRLFRRDEMWLMERGDDNSSRMRSISDFKEDAPESDIRKSYFSGRFGGVPQILLDVS